MKKVLSKIRNIFGNKSINKYTIMLTIISVVLIVGASYALIVNDYFTGKKHSIIAGKLEITFTESNGTFTLSNQIPLTDAQGLSAANNIYSFVIKNTGNVDASYRIKVVDTTVSENKLNVENIKYSLRINDGDWSLPFVLTNNDLGRTLWDGYIDVSEELDIDVKFWLDIDTTASEAGKVFSGKISVESVQLVEDGYTDVLGPTVTLVGDSNVNLLQNGTFTDAGVSSVVDPVEGSLSTNNVKKLYEYFDGNTYQKVTSVDTSVKGVYFITYSIANSSGNIGTSIRVVTVSTNANTPTISLSGDALVSSPRGTLYGDPGATAVDSSSNSLTSDIVKYGYVNPNVGGEYNLKYAVEDSNGNFTGATRKVRVLWARFVYNYTGGYQKFIAPYTGYYNVELNGASGGSGHTNEVANTRYGKGGSIEGKILLTEGETFYVYVGGAGGEATDTTCSNTEINTDTNTGGTAGYNGGGTGGNDGCTSSNSANDAGGGGGGATDIRYFGETTPTTAELAWNSSLGLNSRIMVAGGGGGSTFVNDTTLNIYAGSGGGLIGKNAGKHSSETDTNVGKGGTQNSGNAFGIGSAGIYATSTNIGDGGGGAGYYGATGHTTTSEYVGAGGGGSSFISGYAGVNSITSSSLTNNPRTQTNNTLHYSNKYFIDNEMVSGSNTGNGNAIIAYVGTASPTRVNTSLNNVRYVKNCINGNSEDSYNRWVEFQTIYQGENIAKGLTATGITNDSTYPISNITDGDITSANYARGATGNQCVVVDLGSTYNLDEIAIWHYWADSRTYYNNVTSVSSNGSTYTTVMDNTHAETSEGNRINAYATRKTQYTLTINLNGGETTYPTSYNVIGGDTITLKEPTRTDYTFTGWSINGTGSSVSGNVVTMGTSNAIVTAQWRANEYTVIYNSSGGSGTTANSTHVYNVAQNLTTNGFSKITTGASGMVYRFLGWATSSGSTTVSYTDGQSVSNLASSGTVNLYAVWGNLFTYTGSSYYVDGTASSWIIRLKSVGSYTITFTTATTVDAFVVGGGGAGGGHNASYKYSGGGGGGSGYVATYTSVPSLSANTANTVYVGAGGAGVSAANGNSGTQSYFISTTYKAEGGSGGSANVGLLRGGAGGAGGCGGGGGGINGGPTYQAISGSGGYNGKSGIANYTGLGIGAQGTGSGVTTCEFGQGTASASSCNSGVTMYGGGGAGGTGSRSGESCAVNIGTAGTPGGGAGGFCTTGGAGVANTGGGGGGAGSSTTNNVNYAGGAGGSGIVVLRNHS
ncbi:MAG TPA: glycine-rich protein [Bacilli bacterium]|nr:glycine-rich protein [Bacilli bacterium]